MLTKITIKNIALIKFLELDFCNSLNILSGETGAGKSILIDGIMLLLGAKYDKTILRHGVDDGFVEGVFELSDNQTEILTEFGFEKDELLIVVRKFNSSGKQESRINGRLTTSTVLASIMAKFVDIYGQNEYQSLAKKSMHLNILDAFLVNDLAQLMPEIRTLCQEILSINRSLKNIGSESERARQLDILKFSLGEIEKANVYETEEDELSARRKLISSGEKIAQNLSGAIDALGGSDGSVLDGLHSAKQSLGLIESYSSVYSEILERISSSLIELDDIYDSLQIEAQNLEFDPRELEKIESRLDIIRNLKRKYGSFSDMQKFVKKNSELFDELENGAHNFEKLSKEKNKKIETAFTLATKISTIRKKGAKKFEELMTKELADLGMPDAQFVIVFNDDVSIETLEKYLTPNGMDAPEFYFSANKGQPIKPLTKIISGGELSRFMLALKVVSSSTIDIPTLIFDEVDTGISGKIGQEVAKKLARIASHHQVLCITHLPQIAAMADNHYYIEKFTKDNETQTTVKLLDNSGMIEEISRLSGSKGISESATTNAKETKLWSEKFKKSI